MSTAQAARAARVAPTAGPAGPQRSRRGIATVSLSGLLADKLEAAAAAGFDGVEIFDNDLVASPLSPREVARRCADLGLSIDLLQPLRDVEGLPAAEVAAAQRRTRRKLEVAVELGAPAILVCSSVRPDAIDDPDLSAAQLAALADLAADHGVVLAYEALAWGRHVHRVGQAWDVVRRADHPALTLAVDTFHLLSRGDDASSLAGIPGERIGFLQVADAPLLRMDVLEWSRHHRSFPGQGTLDVAGVVAAVLEAGYDGPVSLEVFSDVVREAPAAETAADAIRSLAYLDDEVARRRGRTPTTPPAPARVDPAFLELPADAGTEDVLRRLGFELVGWHRHKAVARWRRGEAEVLLNAAADRPALGLVTEPVARLAERARDLGRPAARVTRRDDDAALPGVVSPGGLAVFASAADGVDDWRRDFPAPEPSAAAGLRLDHLNLAVDPTRLGEEAAFLRTVLGLAAAPVEEFIDPHGRVLSRAFRPIDGSLRLVLNAVEVPEAVRARRPSGLSQIALACDDLRAEVVRLREAGLPLLAVPENYYRDLQARLDLDDALVEDLRAHGLLYDRIGAGELLHVFTPVLGSGIHLELLERRGGYDGYGAANTHVRLAAQATG
ncbi:sugar phosphate isomerase/epimerase and 4-hydroxyphenylpyruvate domain-containing protein [Nocardioides fonticola]|uniref:3-dehydroshikimate dehydratase n=1 Tax=Nocardioides fonticola TaxID=450363 RepID=A0ABP7XGJ1_9ACTN